MARRFRAEHKEVMETAIPKLRLMTQYQTKKGERRWSQTDIIPHRNEGGTVIGVILHVVDITDRKLEEDKIRMLSHAIEQSPNIIVISDARGIIEYVNPTFTRVTGSTPEDVIGTNAGELGNQPPEAAAKMWEVLNSGIKWHGEFLNKKRDGATYWEAAFISPIVSKEGTVTHLLKVAEDITERKEAEKEKENMYKQLLQAQKMEFIGRLTAGIAHDFNNLLTAIQGYADLAMMNTGRENPVYQDLLEIQRTTLRAASLTNQLLLTSRQRILEPTPININEVIADLLKILNRIIGEDITIYTDLQPDLLTVKADKGNIEQVILNLAVNARDAMPEGGRITIKTENVTLDEKICQGIPDIRPGRYVCVTVEDTGVGMSKEVMQHIFEPFFTTKEAGKGTGLGLSVAYGIIRQHEGCIHAESKVGKGARFRFCVPVSSEGAGTKKEDTISIEHLQGNRERILIVEDEESVRKLDAELLGKSGYLVFTAANAREALEIFERQGRGFDLVFADVVLPGPSGLNLIDQLQEKKPGLKVLLCSGYMDDKARRSLIYERKLRLLQKPYSLFSLLRAVKEVLNGD
jgi:PAS domain S-box-containing protein